MASEYERTLAQVRDTALVEKHKVEAQQKFALDKGISEVTQETDAKVRTLQVGAAYNFKNALCQVRRAGK